MYRCSECGEKYDIKPEYCDCGNDVFESTAAIPKKHVNFGDLIQKYGINPWTLVFFVFCLILSVLILIFFANPKDKPEISAAKQIKTAHTPSIESFWDNTTPVRAEEKEEEPQVIEIIQIIERPAPKAKNSQVNRSAAPKPIQNIKQTSKPAQTAKPASNSAVQGKSKPIQKVNEKEVHNYKIELRNKLFSNLYAGNITGSGKCGVEFSVNGEGKLINRGFTFQSDNKTLNDEVYKMMMRMPVYTPPPSGYKGEKIKITFEFNDGKYEVKLIE